MFDKLTSNKFVVSFFVGAFFTTISYVVAVYAGWVSDLNWLEILAVATSYSCTYLCVVESRWNYPIGILTTFLYSILFFQWGLPAVGIFNLYLVGSLIYGWFRWGPDANTRKVTKFKTKEIMPYTSFGVAVAVLMYGIIVYFDAPVVYLDILVASLSGVAQLMLDNKKLANWKIWAVVNVFSIFLYFNQGLYLAALQYVFFLFNTVYGHHKWKFSMTKQSG